MVMIMLNYAALNIEERGLRAIFVNLCFGLAKI